MHSFYVSGRQGPGTGEDGMEQTVHSLSPSTLLGGESFWHPVPLRPGQQGGLWEQAFLCFQRQIWKAASGWQRVLAQKIFSDPGQNSNKFMISVLCIS